MKRLLLFIALLFSISLSGQTISDYQSYYALAFTLKTKQPYVVLRKFIQNGKTHYLAVDPFNFSSSIFEAQKLDIRSVGSFSDIASKLEHTPYIKSLKLVKANDQAVQDAGITHLSPTGKGVFLTIDLCPSQRPLDRVVFSEIIEEFGNVESPVPLAISITGVWIKKHPDDLVWLKKLIRRNKIAVLWINHTYNHRTSKKLPLTKNFMLEKGTNIPFEILENEKLMIEMNLLPSVFFRFPGLVSDTDIFNRVTGFGLIPVGSDAWLAKNQTPTGGSIVLIHANGNEPYGIKKFVELIKSEKENIKSQNWLLMDLREGLDKEEKN
jgi:hypothetical protein